MIYELTAQPIHEDGPTGFRARSPLCLSANSLTEVFALMGSESGNSSDVGIGAYVDDFPTWSLTLTTRVAAQYERVEEAS